jgi:hypothetical protein
MVTSGISLIQLILLESIIVEVLILVLLYAYLVRKRRKLLPLRGFSEEKEKKDYVKTVKTPEKSQKKKTEKAGTPVNLKAHLRNLKPTKPEHYFILVIYLLVFSVIAYFIVGNIWPEHTPLVNSGEYTINAGSLMIFDKLSSFYIDNDRVLGQKENVNGFEVRKFVSEEIFNLVFKPATPLVGDVNATLEIDLMTDGNSGSNVYLNDKAIIPNLENYELVKDFPDENAAVYVNKNVSYGKASLKDGSSVEDFVYKNFAGNSVYSFKETSNDYVPVLDDYKQEFTTISTTFRDNLKLAVYHGGGNFEIEFIKQDLNSYVGSDEYTVEIKDSKGNSLFKKTYKDDGTSTKTGKTGEEQDFEIKVNIPRGIYYITFTKDNNNNDADSTLKNIRINSNKILLVGTLRSWASFNFYTKVYSIKTIGFKYWWKEKKQIISISGAEDKDIDLDEDWYNKRYDRKLEKVGDYYFRTPIGYVYIYSDYISISKENWFDIPINSQSNLDNQDVIIIDTNKLKIEENKIQYKDNLIVNKDTKFKMKVLDENRIYLENIKLKL